LGRFAVPVKFLSTLSPMGGEVAIVDGEKLWIDVAEAKNWTLMAQWYHLRILNLIFCYYFKIKDYTV
jgi:hypothetical protein